VFPFLVLCVNLCELLLHSLSGLRATQW